MLSIHDGTICFTVLCGFEQSLKYVKLILNGFEKALKMT